MHSERPLDFAHGFDRLAAVPGPARNCALDDERCVGSRWQHHREPTIY